MNDVYIKAEDLNRWIIRHLPQNKDLYSINDLIGAIEDMDGELNDKDREIEELKEGIHELQESLKFYTHE